MPGDGVSLSSTAYPRPPWWRSLLWWFRQPKLDESSLVTGIITLTKQTRQVDRAGPGGAGAPDYVHVSQSMIDAGVECLRDLPRDEEVRYLVEAIYMAMEYERRLPTVLLYDFE